MSGVSRSASQPHVGILGGGITGLTAAFYLLLTGYRVTVVEARPQLGGLATYFDFGSFSWDKFYHCILTSDVPLLQLIADLGLSDELRWTETKVGFYTGGQLHSMTTSLDFLRFPALSPLEKFRLALGILRTSRIDNGRDLEREPIGPWLVKMFGKGNYEKLWEPLLKCKLGSARYEASASFIWATIRRLYSTREKSASKKECLGYVRGGYRTVFARLVERIREMGGSLFTNAPAERIQTNNGWGIRVLAGGQELNFDYVISTLPSGVFAGLVPELDDCYHRKLEKIKYMGMVCAVLVLRRRLTPYYCTNLTEDLPFTGIIEMTNLISLEETQGRHLVYLPKYTSPGDPVFHASDDQVSQTFFHELKTIIPNLKESDIEQRFIFRERLVQPIPLVCYSELIPEMQTTVPGLFLANTTQIINSTLNNNEMVRIARQVVAMVSRDQSDSRRETRVPEVVHAEMR